MEAQCGMTNEDVHLCRTQTCAIIMADGGFKNDKIRVEKLFGIFDVFNYKSP